MKINRLKKVFLSLLFILSLCFCGCSVEEVLREQQSGQSRQEDATEITDSLENIPEFSEEAYVVIGDNVPDFDKKDLTEESFEEYSALDSLGRCGVAYANIGQDIMPAEKRGKISAVHPSGWHNVKYQGVEGRYLYNRCHLIGFQLAGENANEKNLITGTRYMNVEGMLPFENEVAEYVKKTDNHVLYRVTPVYEGDNLVAKGVRMEAYSVEDKGEGVCFDVYVYNNQPGIEIDYETGESHLEGNAVKKAAKPTGSAKDKKTKSVEGKKAQKYVLNANTKKFHLPSCSGVKDMNKENKRTVTETKETLESQGYSACGLCLK